MAIAGPPVFASMRRWLVAGLALCLLAGFSTPGTTPSGDLDSFTAQLGWNGWLADFQVPGAAVALVRGGEVAWAGGYGLADKARGVPVTPDTVFQAASMSKSVTAWGVLRLVEEGRLDLDAPVERYLTRWHLPPSAYDANGVTIRRLLAHSAGLSLHGYPGLPSAQPLPSLEASLAGDNGGVGDVRITLEPGAQFSYSGGGYTLLQLVVEEVTGESFDAYMQRAVLEPLGMTRSGFAWRPDLHAATATGYDADGQPLPNYLFTEQAAAGMAGPHGEPAGRGVLAPATVALLAAPFTLPDHTTTSLAYAIETLPDGAMAAEHAGTNRGWNGQFLLLPDRREGIVVLTNSDNGAAVIASALGAWGQWLGTGEPSASRALRTDRETLHTTMALGAGVLGGSALLWFGYLLICYRAGQRRWAWRPPTASGTWGWLGRGGAMLIAVSAAVAWWMWAGRVRLAALAPAEAALLTLAVLLCCLGVVGTALTRRNKPTPPRVLREIGGNP
jgi:CubicO group peptidase (beta-lactamase class C family)